MSDDDQSLSDESYTEPTPEHSVFGTPPADDLGVKTAVERVLDLDHFMSSARLVERVARLNGRGDLEAEYADLSDELAQLVDVNGNVVADEDSEAALGDQSRAEEISQRMGDLQRRMREESSIVRFRAMPEDEWETFQKVNRNAAGNPKDDIDYSNRMIAKCAVAPTMTLEQVKALRGKINRSQYQALSSAAMSANVTGGLDVPKSPSFWRSPKPTGSSQS